MTTYSTDFGEWLRCKGFGSYLDGSGDLADSAVTQSFFSTQYTAWLNEIVGSAEVREYLTRNGYIDGDDVITVELNQNSAEGVPYIKINGVVSDALDGFFSEREDIQLKTGKVTQTRWYSDQFNLNTQTNTNPTVTAGQQSVPLEEEGVGTDGTSSATIALTLSDPDAGDNAAYDDATMEKAGWTKSADGATFTKTGIYGTATLTIDTHTVSYELDNTLANSLKAGASVTDDFMVYVKDNSTGTASAPVSFAITGTNDNPTVTAGAQTAQLAEAGVNAQGQNVAGTSSATIALTLGDPDAGDTIAYDDAAMEKAGWTKSADGTTFTKVGIYGTATLDMATHAVSYALDNAAPQTNALPVGTSVTDDFMVYVKDGSNGTASALVNFSIDGTNDNPTDIFFSAQEPTAGNALPTTVALLSSIDPDSNATVEYTVTGQVDLLNGDGRVFSVSDSNELQVSAATEVDNDVDRYAVTVTASDTLGGSREETIYITFGTNLTSGDKDPALTGVAGEDIIYALSSGRNQNQRDIIFAGSGNDQLFGQDQKDELHGDGGADIMSGGAGADTFVIGNPDSGITLDTADRITDFLSGTDMLKLGLAGTASGPAATYVEANSAEADFSAALTAANTQLAALSGASTANELYAFQFDSTNGYLFEDIDGNGTADQVIVLVGISDSEIAATDIIA